METIPKCATLGNASRIHVKLKKKTFFFLRLRFKHSIPGTVTQNIQRNYLWEGNVQRL